MYQSFEVAYYSCFLPIKFIPNDLLIYFESNTCLAFTVFIWINSILIKASHYMQKRNVEMKFCAKTIGKFQLIQGKES